MTNDRMTVDNEFEIMCKEAEMDEFKDLSWHYAWTDCGKTTENQVRTAGLWTNT
jgi:hypothetical protein